MCNTKYNINDIVSSSVTILLTLYHKQTKEDEKEMKKIKALLIASFLVLTIVGACFSASAATKVTYPVQQPQQSGEGSITGIIYNESGIPVNGSIVMLFRLGFFVPTQIIPPRDNPDEPYTFNAVPSGYYRIVAAKIGMGVGLTNVFLVTEDVTTTIDVYLDKPFAGVNYTGENGTIAGTVHDENNTVVGSANVLVFEKGKLLPCGFIQSNANGSYTRDVPPGQYRMVAAKLHSGTAFVPTFLVISGATTIRNIILRNPLFPGQQPQQQPQQQQVIATKQVLLSK